MGTMGKNNAGSRAQAHAGQCHSGTMGCPDQPPPTGTASVGATKVSCAMSLDRPPQILHRVPRSNERQLHARHYQSLQTGCDLYVHYDTVAYYGLQQRAFSSRPLGSTLIQRRAAHADPLTHPTEQSHLVHRPTTPFERGGGRAMNYCQSVCAGLRRFSCNMVLSIVSRQPHLAAYDHPTPLPNRGTRLG